MNKKASGFMLASIFMIVLLGASFVAIFFDHVFQDITDELLTQEDFSDSSLDAINKAKNTSTPVLDFFVIFSFIAISIGAIIVATKVPASPVTFIIFIVLIGIILVIAGVWTDVYNKTTTDSSISSTAANFEYSNLLYGDNFPLWIGVVGFICLIIIFVRLKSG